MEEENLDNIEVKCEIIEISDEEVDLGPNKKKRKRIKKKPDPSKRVQCDQCLKSFDNNTLLKRHVRSHGGERPYMCMECGKTYTQLGHLSIHELKHNAIMEEENLDNIEVKCEIIEISDEEVDLGPNKKKRKRIKKKPDPSKRVQCDQCLKSFDNNTLLKRHVRSHGGERPYMCMECGKTYTQLGHLSIHELKHNGVKKFNCSECESAFYRKADLDRHTKIHTGEKNYSCEICSKSFVQKNNLVMHVKMHVGDRRFECTVCNKKFITNSKLVQHSKRHVKEKKKKGRGYIMMGYDDDSIGDGSVLGM